MSYHDRVEASPNLIKIKTPEDLVNRRFTATRPNELWCTDITEHPARDRKVYCCAILDCFSRIIGGPYVFHHC